MAAAKVVGVDVLIKIGTPVTAILGQRGAKMTIKSDKIDLSVKTDAWAKVFKAGWYEWEIACDGVLYAGGTGGIASLVTSQIARTEASVEVTIGSSGEKFTGTASFDSNELDGPHDKEASYSCNLFGIGTLTPVVGT